MDPRFGKVGKQTIEDTGPLTKKRMETIDDETSAAAIDYMKRQHDGRQAVLLLVERHAHAPAHARAARAPRPVQARRQRVHRRHDRARRARSARCSRRSTTWASPNDTIVVYTDRQRPAHEHLAGRRDDAVPRRRRTPTGKAPSACRASSAGPGTIKPGTVTNELMSHNDWIPTLCAIAGEPDIVGKCLKGYDGQRQRPTRSTSTATTRASSSLRSRARRQEQRREERPRPRSSTPTTTACSSAMRMGDYKMQLRRAAHAGHDGRLGRAVHHAAPAPSSTT